MEETVTPTTTQRRIGLSAGVALFAVAFFLILIDHRDGTFRMVALVSFGFLCLATVYRLIKEFRASDAPKVLEAEAPRRPQCRSCHDADCHDRSQCHLLSLEPILSTMLCFIPSSQRFKRNGGSGVVNIVQAVRETMRSP